MLELTLVFLGLSLVLYCVLGGADFGAGVLEIFLGRERRKEKREVLTRAIGPVWEANHIWLIVAVVILFTGFPTAFARISILFHVPLTLLLVGIILRGCAFTFRSYDPERERYEMDYSSVFAFSSVLTPLMIGTVAGALLLGRVPADPTGSFPEVYIRPWLNLFCLSVGLFTVCLFTFLAASYLIGETREEGIRAAFVRRAKLANLASFATGGLVFVTAEIQGLPLARRFLSDPDACSAVLAATVGLGPLWFALGRRRHALARIFAAAQMTLILVGWFKIQFPVLVATSSEPGVGLTLFDAAAPPATLEQLVLALVVGLLVVLPFLGYLFWTFKR